MDIRERGAVRQTAENGQIERRRQGVRTAILAVGDAVVFLMFAAIGRSSHAEANTVLSVLWVAAPFLIGWFLVAPFIGAFKRGLEERSSRMATRTLLAWFVAWPVGLGLRWLFEQRMPQLSFALVTLSFVSAFLLVWRFVFAVVHQMRRF